MSPDIPSTKHLNDNLRAVLEEGSRAVLATVTQSSRLTVGAKILIRDEQMLAGEFGGGPNLDAVIIREAAKFLSGRDEARTVSLSQIAPEMADFADSWVLFERIEVEPKLVIAGAGHVGAGGLNRRPR
jgi:xanthine/CO dehydrogenase XdhC/CoxF family maturation factor